MGFFDSKRKQVLAQEREVLGNPTPHNMVSLVERFMALGDETKALEFARKAFEKFPDSEKVQTTFQNVRKVQLQSEIQDLNRGIRTAPKKSQYERLADLYYRELGNRNKAFEIALEGLAKFPNSDGLHMVSGQVRMERFHQDLLANDFVEAVRHFQKTASVNPNHYKALMSLARLYAEACLYYKAKPVLEQVLVMNPGDEAAERLLRLATDSLANAETDQDDALARIEERHALSPMGAEAERVFEPAGPVSSTPQVDRASLEAFLQGFESMNGYKCAAVLTRDRTCVAAHSRGMVPVEEFTRFLQATHQCSEEAAHKMDIGGFVSGELELSIGRVAMMEWKHYIIGILADQPAKKEDLDGAVERFVSFLSVG